MPNITRIDRTPQSHLRTLRDPRCQARTESTGTYPFDDKKHQCSRLAVVTIDSINFCRLHAGDYLLRLAIAESDKNSGNFQLRMFEDDEENKIGELS